MSNQLTIYEGGTLANIMEVSKIMAASGLFDDTRQQAQAAVKGIAGYELGFGPFASMSGLHLIKGKVAIGAHLMASAVKSSAKYDYKVRELSSTACILEFFEGKDSIGISSFTIEEARAAGTQNLHKFPRNMLFARAMSNGVKWYCPDVFSQPVYVPEELGAKVDGEGEIIEMPTPQATITEIDWETKEEKAARLSKTVEQPQKITYATNENIAKWLDKLNSLPEVGGYFKHAKHLQNALKLEAFPQTFHNGDMERWQGIKAAAIAYAQAKQEPANEEAFLEIAEDYGNFKDAVAKLTHKTEAERQALIVMYHDDSENAWAELSMSQPRNGLIFPSEDNDAEIC